MGCGGDGTVATDAATATTASELMQLDAALTNLDKAMATSMNAFNDLIAAVDHVSHIYSNLAIVCSSEVRDRLKTFDVETRGMQEKGLYASLNQDVITGSVTPFNPLKNDVKTCRKTLDSMKKAQAEYESCRKKVELKESEFAKKGQQVSGNAEYQKQVKDRDQKKKAFETEKSKFESQMSSIRTKMNQIVVKSSINYSNCARGFFEYMEKVLQVFGNADKPAKLTALNNNYRAPHIAAPAADPSPAPTPAPAAPSPAPAAPAPEA